MKYIKLFVIPMIMLFITEVSAHAVCGPRMIAAITIDAPADKVWDIIKNFDDMSQHPDIKNTTTYKGEGDKTFRVLQFNNDETVVEKLKNYKPERMFYRYKYVELSAGEDAYRDANYMVSTFLPISPVTYVMIKVKDIAGKSLVKWEYRYYIHPFAKVGEATEVTKKMLESFITKGLVGLAQKFDSHASAADVSIKKD